MSGEPPADGSSAGRGDYGNWSIASDEHADANYVGTTAEGTPVYHGEGRVFHGEPNTDERTVTPIPNTERSLEPGEAIADVIEEIGETLGWESLSEFGEERRR